MKENELAKYWDSERGISLIPWDQLPQNMERFCEGSYLDVESLPPDKRSESFACLRENSSVPRLPFT